jgi:hypothetical protein
MARYSLRNQEKIKYSLGENFHKWLMLSLDELFKKGNIIEYDYEGEKFKVIHAENVQPHTDSFFELYVLSKKFDVYNLAYKGCAG